MFFIIQDFYQLALALKTAFALKFFKPRGGRPPTPSLVRLCASQKREKQKYTKEDEDTYIAAVEYTLGSASAFAVFSWNTNF